MTGALIWLHEDALRANHSVFAAAGSGALAVHVWDDAYLREANYSLKRLVFVYETLCELKIPIVRGDTVATLVGYEAERIFIPESPNPFIQSVARRLEGKQVTVVPDEPFVVLKKAGDFKRFFQYWSKAEKSVFLRNGGALGQDG